MTISRLASLRLVRAASLALAAAMTLAACSADSPPATPSPVPSGASSAPSVTPAPTPSPTPTPAPTPRFTNEPDEELAGLIPTSAAGATVVVAPFDQFGLTPGDVATAYGEIGNRFASLVLAYIGQPRTSLYAMRVDGDPVATEDLEPYLATAGRYVGIAGLDPDPWKLGEAGGHAVWVRPEDNATALGTMIYTWSSGEFVFLLIGVDDTVNRAVIEQLPGEPAPSATPIPSASGSAEPSESPEG
ncbi:MAG TPA: hypothetical protein VJ975_11290 [Candidatus Limnocylindria bacterium]|nr:hypothetical protein [Candidatus Limnocylindria bacterium]